MKTPAWHAQALSFSGSDVLTAAGWNHTVGWSPVPTFGIPSSGSVGVDMIARVYAGTWATGPATLFAFAPQILEVRRTATGIEVKWTDTSDVTQSWTVPWATLGWADGTWQWLRVSVDRNTGTIRLLVPLTSGAASVGPPSWQVAAQAAGLSIKAGSATSAMVGNGLSSSGGWHGGAWDGKVSYLGVYPDVWPYTTFAPDGPPTLDMLLGRVQSWPSAWDGWTVGGSPSVDSDSYPTFAAAGSVATLDNWQLRERRPLRHYGGNSPHNWGSDPRPAVDGDVDFTASFEKLSATSVKGTAVVSWRAGVPVDSNGTIRVSCVIGVGGYADKSANFTWLDPHDTLDQGLPDDDYDTSQNGLNYLVAASDMPSAMWLPTGMGWWNGTSYATSWASWTITGDATFSSQRQVKPNNPAVSGSCTITGTLTLATTGYVAWASSKPDPFPVFEWSVQNVDGQWAAYEQYTGRQRMLLFRAWWWAPDPLVTAPTGWKIGWL